MKAPIIYSTGPHHGYRARTDIEIARSGKWLNLGLWKPRISSIVWGAATPELLAEAKAINALLKEVDAKRHALNAKLKATQPALLAAAAKAPHTPKPPPFRLHDGPLPL